MIPMSSRLTSCSRNALSKELGYLAINSNSIKRCDNLLKLNLIGPCYISLAKYSTHCNTTKSSVDKQLQTDSSISSLINSRITSKAFKNLELSIFNNKSCLFTSHQLGENSWRVFLAPSSMEVDGRRDYSNQKQEDNTAGEKSEETPPPKDKKSRFKALVRDYGLTAVVFHVTISLASLGICWLLVESSLPMDKIFTFLGIDKKLGDLSTAASTSTNFVVAYALHKSFALVRLSITAACVPVLVRYLRAKNILKPVADSVKK